MNALEAWEQTRETSYAGLPFLSMSWSHLNDPKHWRARAIEARTMAEHITDPASKQMMLSVAAEYEHPSQARRRTHGKAFAAIKVTHYRQFVLEFRFTDDDANSRVSTWFRYQVTRPPTETASAFIRSY